MPFPENVQYTVADQRGDVPDDPATYFSADIRGGDMMNTTTAVRLDDMLGNNNGAIAFGGKDFTKTARNVKILDNNNSVVSGATSPRPTRNR